MRIHLDHASAIPLSEQLRVAIARKILRGTLPPGARVPTIRELAATTALAPNTVAKAYRALEAEGLLVGRGRLGTFVADRIWVRPSDVQARLRSAAEAFVRRTRGLGASDEEAREAVRRAQLHRPA